MVSLFQGSRYYNWSFDAQTSDDLFYFPYNLIRTKGEKI